MTVADFQALERASPFPPARWAADYAFHTLPETIRTWRDTYGTDLDLEPDFQRAHEWTEAQQAAFIEYVLSGGPSGRDLYFACEGWSPSTGKDDQIMVIVDGKQRLTAVLAFVEGRLRVRGRLISEWTGVMRARFRFHIADIDRATTLRWYLGLNAGGTPHTPAEIERVRVLLRMEEMKLERAAR